MAQPDTIAVEVLVPGLPPQQKQFALPGEPGPVSCLWVQQELQHQFGAGHLYHAVSDVILAPAGELQPGSYVYRSRSTAGRQAVAALTSCSVVFVCWLVQQMATVEGLSCWSPTCMACTAISRLAAS
jgi:hypothetical protein